MFFMHRTQSVFMILIVSQVFTLKLKNAPNTSKARYITEDVPYLFIPFCELADLCGVDVPIAKALVTIASYYNDEDYMKTGRTLAKMGFNHWTKQEILAFLES